MLLNVFLFLLDLALGVGVSDTLVFLYFGDAALRVRQRLLLQGHALHVHQRLLLQERALQFTNVFLRSR